KTKRNNHPHPQAQTAESTQRFPAEQNPNQKTNQHTKRWHNKKQPTHNRQAKKNGINKMSTHY
ncbi:hypothetical protein, partial [Williamsia sp. CHRR-6]|uniref:hypothetical protein n=1 Tax=Williamsia sp. CHRR-6 TaxID=2835871 RepID=UPI001BDA4BA6